MIHMIYIFSCALFIPRLLLGLDYYGIFDPAPWDTCLHEFPGVLQPGGSELELEVPVAFSHILKASGCSDSNATQRTALRAPKP